MTKIVLASGNQGKLREFARLLSELNVTLVSMSDLVPAGFEVEETGITFEDNAWLKALAVCEATGLPALSDDSGIEVDALDGWPGVYSARYAGMGASDQDNNDLLLRELAGVPADQRSGRFVCCLAFAVPGPRGARRVASVRGIIEGHIVEAPRGQRGFGYDPLFEPRDFPGRTTAELTGEEKDAISHRGQAARAMASRIFDWQNSRTSG